MSPDPIADPLADPILATLTRARHHLVTHTLHGYPASVITAALLDPGVLDAVAHVNTIAATGDVLATQGACQRWHRALQQALKNAE